MRLRTVSALLGLALAVSMTTAALAQTDGDPAPAEGIDVIDQAPTAPVVDQAAAPLFVQVLQPAERDVEVAADTADLAVIGVTRPGSVVSLDGDLLDVDDQGNFSGMAHLDEGVNEIDLVVSDAQGNQLSTTLFVVRGE